MNPGISTRFYEVRVFGDFVDNRFHLSLLPAPFGGDLEKAGIYILLLNPGFSYSDYYAEHSVAEFRRRKIMNLQQAFTELDFPLLWLDPNFCWHNGFLWWEGKLRRVITEIARRWCGGSYIKALRDVATHLAFLELVPYHSQSFNSHRLLDKLPSAQMAKQYVREILIPEANAGKKTIIVTRQAAEWGWPGDEPDTNNLFIYRKGHTRGASLGPQTKGGKAILDYYERLRA